jgi:hypothetical protein
MVHAWLRHYVLDQHGAVPRRTNIRAQGSILRMLLQVWRLHMAATALGPDLHV